MSSRASVASSHLAEQTPTSLPSSNSKHQLMLMLSAIVLETDREVSNTSTLLQVVPFNLHCSDGELMAMHNDGI